MIKVFTNKSLLLENENQFYIHPLISSIKEYPFELSNTYSIVDDIDTCDIVVLPVAIDFLYKQKKQDWITQFFEVARLKNKIVFAFTSGDIGLTINNPNICNLRLGGFKTKMDGNTFIMPPFINDPYAFLNKEVKYIQKPKAPTIGFVGHSNGSFFKLIKELILYLKINTLRLIKKEYIDYQPFYPSSFFRHKYLTKLVRELEHVKTNFIFRKSYRAGVKTDQERFQTSMEFYDNIYNNAYTFCIRGVGNWSVRLYETLALGRIPILINTNCKLPFDNHIDWKLHCVIIEENEIEKIVEKLNEFHSRFSEKDFVNLQKSNRKLWQAYFTKTGFFNKMSIEIENIIISKA
ncbi:MAG: exostosin family protein [Algibacter sp.]